MIVLDSSVLVAIIKGEEDGAALLSILDSEQCAVGAPTLVETRAWCALNLRGNASHWLEAFVEGESVSVVPFGREMADLASQAFAKFGRGSGHRAKLNFGDCMAYATAAALRAPLLFKGADFARTDVMSHPASIRT